MASSSGPPRHHDEPVHGRERERESTSSTAAATSADDSIAAAAEGSPEETGGGGGGGGRSGSAAAAVDQGGKEKVVEGSQEATKKNKVDSPLKKFIRRSILAVSEGFKKKIDKESNRMGQAHQTRHLMWITRKFPWEKLCIIILGTFIMLSKRERESAIIARLVPLHGHYSALRPVHRDGESFYRSFIFSYLEQIVDRVDTHEEDRLLAAVRELARRAEHFQWASEFSRRRKAFEMLIEKIKGWKHMLQYPTLRVRFLKRLAAAIWMCSPDHRGMYAPGVIGPGDGRSLENWCSTQVIPPRVYADEVAVRALAAALQVFIRVEMLEHGGRQDSYYIARDRPHVTLLCMDSQYDIAYPLSAESIHRRVKQGGVGGASRFNCCIGGDSNLQRLSQQQEQRGGGGQQHPDRAGSSSQGAGASWFHSCAGGSKKKQSSADEADIHGHGRGQLRREHQGSRAAASSTDASSSAAAAHGGANVPPPPPSSADRLTQQPGGTDGSSAAADQKGKKPISASDDRKQARRKKEERKSDYPKEKLLGDSIRAYQGPGNEELSDRKREQSNCPGQNSGASMSIPVPHVYYKKLPMGDALYYYFTNFEDALQQPKVGVRLKFLDRDYSEFRPVVPDGECFYRSFIFSYLEQVVDRIDTRWEDRLLAAVRELDRQAEHFQWASELSRRREVFERLIAKIKGWKRMRDYPPSRVSYNNGEFLLELFNSYESKNHISAFLRLVAATWMCTHKGKYGRHVREGRSLEDWCSTQVIPPGVETYLIVIRALAEALRVAVRVENVNNGTTENTHYNIVHGTPQVTLLRIESSCDIIYPLPPSATGHPNQPKPLHGRGSQQHPDPAAETSSQGAARAGFWWFDCCFVVPKESLSQGPKESYPFPPSATGRPNQPRPLHGRGSQQHPDPAAETSSQGAAKAGFWWFDCCFVVLKENLSQGSTASARSGHELQSRPSRTQPKQIPH
uniref:OTU domain-containing protein n=1 Tax=Oryza punctata TaxID=4537 RepID=A0A0E0K0D9_ORYPU